LGREKETMQMMETLEKIFDVEEMKKYCGIETSIGLNNSTVEPTTVHLCIFVIELEVGTYIVI